MKRIRKIVVGFLLLLLLLSAVAYLLPRQQHIERSRVIASPAEKIWPWVVAPRQWNAWSPWYARDPQMQITYHGPDSGVGAGWHWHSRREGSGSMQFQSAQPHHQLQYAITFDGMGTSTGYFTFTPVGQATRVTWVLNSELGYNPLNRWFGLALDTLVGRDFETGLANLERVATGK